MLASWQAAILHGARGWPYSVAPPFEGKTLILRTNCLVKSKSRASSLITFLHLAAGVTLNNSPPNVSSALLTQKAHPFSLTHYRILIAFLPGQYIFLSNQTKSDKSVFLRNFFILLPPIYYSLLSTSKVELIERPQAQMSKRD